MDGWERRNRLPCGMATGFGNLVAGIRGPCTLTLTVSYPSSLLNTASQWGETVERITQKKY